MYLNLRTMEKSAGLAPADSTRNNDIQTTTDVPKGSYQMSQDNGFLVPENVILQTTNYSMFKFDQLNRTVRQDRLDNLYDAVQAKNLLHLFPIVVTRDRVVIDGQHRLRVAEALNVPIYYIVSDQMQIEDAARVNVNVTLWRGRDYLDHFCKIGLGDYIVLRDFLDANKFLTFTLALRLLSFGSSGPRAATRSLTQAAKEGKFKVNDLAFATEVVNAAQDFSRWGVKFWKDNAFVMTLANLIYGRVYEHQHMMRKMEYLSTRLVRCPDQKGYVAVFEEIYNYKTQDKHKVTFQVPPPALRQNAASRD